MSGILITPNSYEGLARITNLSLLWEAELWLLQDVYVVISEFCEYVMCHGKRKFADVTNMRILRQMMLDDLGGPNVITKVLLCVRGRQES